MATKEAAALATAVEEGKTRDLYNALRTGEHGVSLEALAQSLYFLQHAEFTLFDVKDAFRSSTGASERFLAYREFQIALGKIARVKCCENCGGNAGESVEAASSKHIPRPTELELIYSLVDQLTNEHHHNQLDTLRCQMTRCSVLETLEHNMTLLVQSFQLYGSQNRLSPNIALSTITLDGFVNFLNAYFEYEEFLSFDDLARMSTEVVSGFARTFTKSEVESSNDVPTRSEGDLNFAQFLELFCRVAAAFHHKLLVREGAQLRRAVESCRLEFSLEVLLDHMRITLIPNDSSLLGNTNSEHQQDVSTAASGVMELAAGSSQSPRGDELVSMTLLIQNIRDVLRLDAADHPKKKPKIRLKREGSLVMQGQLSKRPSSNPAEQALSNKSTPRTYSATSQHSKVHVEETRKPPPQVAMIREVVMPPSLPSDVIQLLESTLKFQNMAQYNMALSTLDSCKQHYQAQNPPPSDTPDPIQIEVQLFLTLQAASVYDSAHQDEQALTKYYEAMKLSRQLPASHPGRLLVKSCVGVTLFYAGELTLAQQCHQLVLDARKAISAGVDRQSDRRAAAKTDNDVTSALVDTATAMNNLACCLSQDRSDSTSKALDNAYLLFKHARQVYADAFGPAHPRVELITRNLDRVRASQSGVVSDAAGALARGEYRHVIPGSTFQIQAFEFVAKPIKSKGGKAGGKKKKKEAN